MTRFNVAALVNGAIIDCGLCLDLSHLWTSEKVKQYRTRH